MMSSRQRLHLDNNKTTIIVQQDFRENYFLCRWFTMFGEIKRANDLQETTRTDSGNAEANGEIRLRRCGVVGVYSLSDP